MTTSRSTPWLCALAVAITFAAAPVHAAPKPCTVVAKTNGDQTVAEATVSGGVRTPTVVQLNGTPSQDEDTYAWAQDPADAYQVTLSDAGVARPEFSAPNVGPAGAVLHFTLTVTGCGATQTRSTVTSVTVTNVNGPPVASATVLPATVSEGETFTLDGSGSSDPDGDALTYAWTQIVGGVPVLPPLSTSAVATVTAPVDVPYPAGVSLTFRLTVSDGTLSSSTDQVVTVKWVNDPPIARAKCDTPVDEGASVSLDGTASTDDEDGIVSYAWSQVSGGPDADLPSEALSNPGLAFYAPALKAGHGATMVFGLKVTDALGLFGIAQCSVTVRDVTPPVIAAPGDITREATSAAGAAVSFAVTATDAYDGDVPVTCAPPSGGTFGLGTTTVTCNASDKAGNPAAPASFGVTVQDTTPPALSVPAAVKAEATGPGGAAVTFGATAYDLVDGAVSTTCAPASGSTFALGTTTVACTATDAHGNMGSASFAVEVVDTTPPAITVPADVTTGPTEAMGAKVSYGPASASDLVDGAVTPSCAPASGTLFGFGTTTVTCSAQDSHGNGATKAFTVTVTPFTFLGFFQPVDALPSVNAVKNGATVPVKWKLQGQGGMEIGDVNAVQGAAATNISCSAVATELEAPIEMTTTGGTSLRYDPTALQFIFNWQTPRQAGTCWRIDLQLRDGTVRSAHFKLK